MPRRLTRKVLVGKLAIGNLEPISIESMASVDSTKLDELLEQITELKTVGCDIVRIAIYDQASVKTIKFIKDAIEIPLVADIHFDYRLAISAIENGIDMVRINPGNIGKIEGVKSLVTAAKNHAVPLRVGVNAGSLSDEILKRFGNTSRAMVESAMEHVSILEKLGFYDILLSLKASNVIKTVEACRQISALTDYPLHLGITEAGTEFCGSIKSAIGIGSLFLDGIGDTFRVSLTAPPREEIKVAKEILKSLNLRNDSVEIISCPTCGRCKISIMQIANELQKRLVDVKKPIKVAVMGCAVNGPGEAKEADVGIAGGKGKAVVFKKGQIVGTVSDENIIDTLITEVRKMESDGSFNNNTSV